MKRQQEAEKLIKKYVQGNCSDEERVKVDAWLNAYGKVSESEWPIGNSEELSKERAWRNILDNQVGEKKIKRISWYKWTSVAAVFIAAAFLLLYVSKYSNTNIEKSGASHAGAVTLVLENGEKMNVDSTQKDEVLLRAGLRREEINGRTLYRVLPAEGDVEVAIRTLITGSQERIQIELLDGTKVWLNAGSELKFPQVFQADAAREVSLKGEGYFHVAKDRARPFKVHSAGQTVEVLGTVFNVNAYTSVIKTSLLEGSVKIADTVLEPGDKATWSAGDIKVRHGAIENDFAWIDGYLSFLDDDIISVCTKLKYWYDVDFVFVGDIPKERLNGTIDLSNSLEEALTMLEKTSRINFKIEGRKIIVKN